MTKPERKHLWVPSERRLELKCKRVGCDQLWLPHQLQASLPPCEGEDPK